MWKTILGKTLKNLLINTYSVLVSYIKYSTVILSRLVTTAHQISNKLSKDAIKSWHQRKKQKTGGSNCSRKQEYRMEGKCRAESSLYIYGARSNNIRSKTYLYASKSNFKKRYQNHTKPFRNLKYSKETKLSGFFWNLKNKNIAAPQLKWPIEKNAPAYSNISKR